MLTVFRLVISQFCAGLRERLQEVYRLIILRAGLGRSWEVLGGFWERGEERGKSGRVWGESGKRGEERFRAVLLCVCYVLLCVCYVLLCRGFFGVWKREGNA